MRVRTRFEVMLAGIKCTKCASSRTRVTKTQFKTTEQHGCRLSVTRCSSQILSVDVAALIELGKFTEKKFDCLMNFGENEDVIITSRFVLRKLNPAPLRKVVLTSVDPGKVSR